MKKRPTEKCAGCGHKLSQHREYDRRGTNRHGCRLVCTVNGCKAWDQCRRTAGEGK